MKQVQKVEAWKATDGKLYETEAQALFVSMGQITGLNVGQLNQLLPHAGQVLPMLQRYAELKPATPPVVRQEPSRD